MLKYWTLYDSFFYSSYTIPKLKTWHDSGRFEIRKLIATLGIRLEDAQEKFEFLAPAHRETLRDKLPELDGRYDFHDILLSTFTLNLDSKHQYNSLDFFAVIAAVLNGHRNFGEFVLGADKGGAGEEFFQSNREENFWCAYHKLLERWANQ